MTKGLYDLTYTPYVAGNHTLEAYLVDGGGLFATFYSMLNDSVYSPFLVSETLLLNDAAMAVSGMHEDQYLVHIHGFLRSNSSSNTLLQFENSYQSSNDRIKLWFDGELIIGSVSNSCEHELTLFYRSMEFSGF